MYGYTVTVYYTCTVDSRTDPKSGTLFFSFRFHASTYHCRYYCLFLAVNYKNFSSIVFQPSVFVFRPPSSSNDLRLPTTTSALLDHSLNSSPNVASQESKRSWQLKYAQQAHSNISNTNSIMRNAKAPIDPTVNIFTISSLILFGNERGKKLKKKTK